MSHPANTNIFWLLPEDKNYIEYFDTIACLNNKENNEAFYYNVSKIRELISSKVNLKSSAVSFLQYFTT